MTAADLNWLPLLVFLAIGFLIGWLVTGLPQRRRLAQVQADVEGLNAKLQQANSDLSASQQRERGLQENLNATNASLATSQQRAQELQGAVEQGAGQLVTLQSELAERDGELATLKLQDSALRSATQQAYGSINAQVDALQAQVRSLSEENSSLKANLEGISADLAKARADFENVSLALSNKDTALTEAYGRAVRLERETTDEQNRLLALQAEVATLKREKATLLATNQDALLRLENARGEVANELAVLTSTMLRVKDEELSQANATIAALQSQLAQTTVAA